jgi:hypothetical protein
MIEIIITLASALGSCVRYVATRVLGMTISDDNINDIVQRELKQKYSGC